MTKERLRANLRGKEQDIFRYVQQNPGMRRTELAEKMREEIRWTGKPPEVEVLEKKITECKKRLSEPNPQDTPWHLGTLADYPIPPEALPTVLNAWLFLRQPPSWEEAVYGGGPPVVEKLTIREAKWVARLHAVFQEEDKGELVAIAQDLAMDERVEEDFKAFSTERERDHEILDICQRAGWSISEEWLKKWETDRRTEEEK